jgi:IS5 family transposase
VDAQTEQVHAIVTTAAHESDVGQTHMLLHGDEKHVHMDAGYQDARKREELRGCAAGFVIARRRSTHKKLDETDTDPVRKLFGRADPTKAGIRSRVEHVIQAVKSLLRHRKCR